MLIFNVLNINTHKKATKWGGRLERKCLLSFFAFELSSSSSSSAFPLVSVCPFHALTNKQWRIFCTIYLLSLPRLFLVLSLPLFISLLVNVLRWKKFFFPLIILSENELWTYFTLNMHFNTITASASATATDWLFLYSFCEKE